MVVLLPQLLFMSTSKACFYHLQLDCQNETHQSSSPTSRFFALLRILRVHLFTITCLFATASYLQAQAAVTERKLEFQVHALVAVFLTSSCLFFCT